MKNSVGEALFLHIGFWRSSRKLAALIEEPQEDVRPERRVNHIRKRLKIGRELRMTTQTRDYDMDYIIMDLGYDVNILIRQTWESMGNSRLVTGLMSSSD